MVKPQRVRQLEVSPAPCDQLGVLHSDPPAQEHATNIYKFCVRLQQGYMTDT